MLESSEYQHAKYRCTYILNHIDDPWTNPLLSSILNNDDDLLISVEQLDNRELNYKHKLSYFD